MSDLISRQAVRLIESDPDAYPQEWNDDYEKGFTDALNKVLALPSTQPEPLTDKEQRIFLAAMGREEKVCEEVDAEWLRECEELYKDSLVMVCHDIIRKVKGVLWT